MKINELRSPLTLGLAALVLLAAAAGAPCERAEVVTASVAEAPALERRAASLDSVTLDLDEASPAQVRALLRRIPGGELIEGSVPEGQVGKLTVISHKALSPSQALFTLEQALERLTLHRGDVTAYVTSSTAFEDEVVLKNASQRRDIAIFHDRARNLVIAVGPTGRMKDVMGRDRSRKADKIEGGERKRRGRDHQERSRRKGRCGTSP